MVPLQKFTVTADASDRTLRCSFCGKAPSEGGTVVAGQDVSICDHCIAACTELIADDSATSDHDTESTASDDERPPETAPPRPPMFFRLLRDEDVAGLLSMDELIDEMKGALRRFSTGEIVQPVRTVIPVGHEHAFLGLMPAYVREPGTIGAKLVTMFPQNATLGLPTHLATILLFSPETGALVGVMNGRYVTEARTAAVSAVSAILLARQDAETMAIIGSGVQARSHLMAMERVFDLQEVRAWSPSLDHVADFVDEMEPTAKAALVVADSAERAVRDADLVVLVTSSSEPVIRNAWVKDGAHVISVGACRPDQREMDPALVERGRLYVDSREAALVESGDIVMGIEESRFTASHIAGELGELIAGTVTGRRWPHDVTIFKSLGLAVEDVIAADLIYRRAIAQDVGEELEL